MDHTSMKILTIYLTLLVIARCENLSSTTETILLKLAKSEYNESENSERSTEEENELPILPPIILLDFGESNSTSSADKSKRTIENGLGYGYLRNNLLNGKYNYYFPGGKTGTTVSIEESISPFEPKTIIEPYEPIGERPILETPPMIHQANSKASNHVINHQIYGQRTKLQKYSSPYNHYNPQTYSSTPKSTITDATIRANYKIDQSTYPSPKAAVYQQNYASSPMSPNENYPATSPAPSYTSTKSLQGDLSALNLPKYTIENGIRYENKIVWRYPDGRIVNTPPASYVNSYSEYSNPERIKTNNAYQNPSTQDSRYSEQYESRYPSNPVSNIYNQRPAQFPQDQESSYEPLHSSGFNAPNNYNSGASSQAKNYDFSYQQKYGLQQRENNQGIVSNYAVDSPNAETSTTPAAKLSQSFNRNNPAISKNLPKYSPQVQRYLSKVLGQNEDEGRRNQYNYELSQYNRNLNYESILNYNPSISQYIRNPASILNAQPTFIQAGNSLIPVIILRVDGARPVQSKPSPSINLKALLQQYLSDYAQNNAALTQTSNNYKYKESLNGKSLEHDTLHDLTQLTQALRRFSHNEQFKNKPIENLANHPLEYDSTTYFGKTSYDTIENFNAPSHSDEPRLKYGSKVGTKQKIKNVQIIENS